MRIEFLWFDGCPGHREARALLDDVLRRNGIDPTAAVESIRVDEASVTAHRFTGSPTIRIDGRDVEPGFADGGDYSLACRLQGVPKREWIEDAIRAATGEANRS